MVDRLNEPESRFHASLVSNVLDLVNLLPQLNVGEDPELNCFAGEIRNKLCGFTARDLKTNDVLRVATANDAAALLYEMDALLREREQKQDSASEGTCRQTASSRTDAVAVNHHMAATAKWSHEVAARSVWRARLKAVSAGREAEIDERLGDNA
jgi:hypothetical protein